ncbi:chaperone modulator CbpM [Candidatus Methylomicrobium oryzae]|jgi:chaperone modulatory protein CbpM|uniref:chaperone modulator CbpM n=1 Tax=Candidatus Methylomicrobium oryzae TaxID=2802053 RepID=UPI001920F00B|nr:chaperone modulator CbpM [Methylomicrobium sp. RS1]MBL1262975.1 chaperone modulator CbpM [Methylomicrobium sp. RS1]
MKKELLVVTGTVMDESVQFSLVELCECAKTTREQVFEMVEEGILEPEGASIHTWRFDTRALKRVQIAIRLQHDLGVNLPGSALVLDLLEEMETLRRQMRDF